MANERLIQCRLCNGIGKFSCMLCGSAVCSLHYDAQAGVCAGCGKGRSI